MSDDKTNDEFDDGYDAPTKAEPDEESQYHARRNAKQSKPRSSCGLLPLRGAESGSGHATNYQNKQEI